MKIAVLFTGGTIQSRIGESGTIATDSEAPYLLIEDYKSNHPDSDTIFDTREVYRILSENLQARHLELLVKAVNESLKAGEYDGIIITHGSDTLQYSASMLDILFDEVTVPIVLVASNYPLTDARANGAANFAGAVELIRATCKSNKVAGRGLEREAEPGVYISYRNGAGPVLIHRGIDLLPHVAYSDEMHSIGEKQYGKVLGGSFILFGRVKDELKTGDNRVDKEFPNGFVLSENTSEICRIRPYPGMTYPEINDKVKVVLMESYHCGTICICEELKALTAKACSLGIPVYLVGLGEGEAEYETVEQYRALGIRTLKPISPIAAYNYLWILLSAGRNPEELVNYIQWEKIENDRY